LKKKQKTFIRLGRKTPTADIAFQTLIDKVFFASFCSQKRRFFLQLNLLISRIVLRGRGFIRSREGFRVRANNRIV